MAGDDGRAQVQLDEDTLARRRRDLGEDHPDTLSSADGLAISLRAVGGYPGTLTPPATSPPAFVTPASTRRPGSSTKTPWPAAAASWARTTPTPWPRPTTSPSACRGSAGRRPGNWAKTPWPAAAALFELGEYQAARELNEDILARRRRVLGEDHRDTGASATFAIFLRTPRPLLKTLGWVSRRRRAG
jgi:hypothetical protein